MHELKVFTGADLYQLSENQLMHDFGKFGYMLYRRVRGIDDRPSSTYGNASQLEKNGLMVNL